MLFDICVVALAVSIGGPWVLAIAAAAVVVAWLWPGALDWPRKPPPRPVDPDALRGDPVF